MPLTMIRQDITKLECDAIVNAANSSLLGGGTLVRLTYNKDCVGEALISEVSRLYGVDMNILLGSLELLEGNPLGGLIVRVDGEMDRRRAAIQYLCEHNVIVEVIEHG